MISNEKIEMCNVLTQEENNYIKDYLRVEYDKNDIYEVGTLKKIEERKKIIQAVLNCLDERDKYLVDIYTEEKNVLDNIEKKIVQSLNGRDEKLVSVKIEIMKNALNMYIRDTAEKIIFVRNNMGNDNGMMNHFIEMLDIAKGMKNEL